jgi:hypothetical protein
VGAGDLKGLAEEAAPVTVGVVFDTFPASVRGAVVVRGQDPEPHQIRMSGASVVEAHSLARPVQPIPVEEAVVDVAPRGEVLIPFDVPFAELRPGWYCISADVVVDGSLRVRGPEGGGKRFVVPWPSEEVRRADLRPNLKVGRAVIERVECRADRTSVRWRPGAGETELRVSAGTRRLPVVEATDDPRTGVRTTVTHPVPKRATHLTFEAPRGAGRSAASATLELS